MAAFTSKATGNWSAEGNTTWTENGHPGTGDTVTISNTHTITVDDNTSVGATIVEGGLTLGTSVTLTMVGDLTIGNGASKDGTLTFGAGSTLALGSSDLLLNNCFVRSNAVTDNWAKVTGDGSSEIKKGSAYSYPKQDVDISYVSFQNQGVITITASGSSGTGETNQINISYCTFNGNGAVTFGEGGVTPLASTVSITYCDFVDLTGNLIFTGLVGDATGTRLFQHNTLYQSATYRGMRMLSTDGFSVKDNVFVDFCMDSSQVHSAGGWTMEGNFFSRPVTGDTAINMVHLNDGEDGETIQDNYFYSEHKNPHFFGGDGGANGGSGNHLVKGNVFESNYSGVFDDSGNCVPFQKHPLDVQRNIAISTGRALNLIFSAASYSIEPNNIVRNTVYSAIDDNSSAILALFEGDIQVTGIINLVNNLISGGEDLISGVQKITAGDNQTIAYAGYNDWHNVTTPYGNRITITSGPTGDLDDIDPGFVDKTRALATWDAEEGSETGTAAAAITYFLGINGYSAVTKTQSGTPSAKLPSDLVTWVKAGFGTLNSLLHNAGDVNYSVDGSYDIGAMDYVGIEKTYSGELIQPVGIESRKLILNRTKAGNF